ncbi:MAG: MFS transporter [Candidatus Lokiarchaeota archaeon]|nr:MFS transporter [Candidatus Lokiarchaeota archaeon]
MESGTIDDSNIRRYPKSIIASFQFGNLVGLMMSQMYSQQLTFFYLSEVGLDIIFYVIGMVIYTLFNMFNDPLLGHLCDKSTRFTKRWGKRFPFIMLGAIPWCFVVIFIYIPPSLEQIGQVGIFLWFTIFLCVNDLVFSLFDINRLGLFPDKFRHPKDRSFGGAITVILETTGIVFGIAIPVLTVEFLGPEMGWKVQAFVVAFVALIFMLLMIPGVREDQEMKKRRDYVDRISPEPFFKGLKKSLKDKHLMGFIALYLGYTATMGIIMASIPFFVQDILQLSKIGEFIVLFYVFAVLISAGIWYKISLKIGIKNVSLIGGGLLACMGFPLLFVPIGPEGLPIVIIIFTISGFVDGAIIAMIMPLFSSVVDNATLENKKRQEGLYNGVWMFFARIGLAIRAIVFWLVQMLFGYQSGSTEPFELLGLRVQMSIVPFVIIISGLFIFWKLYTITPEMIEYNAMKLKEIEM